MHNPIFVKSATIDREYFYKIVLFVFLVIFIYSGVYYALGARLAGLALLSCSLLFTPAILICDLRGYESAARWLFFISNLFYIYATPFGIRAPMSAELYYIIVLVLPIVLFAAKQRWYLLSSIFLCLCAWAIQKFVPMPELSPYWIPPAFPTAYFEIFNFLTTGALMSLFLKFFIESTYRSTKDLQQLLNQSNSILESANLGSWEWRVHSELIAIDTRCIRILGLNPDTSHLNVLDLAGLIHPEDLKEKTARLTEHLSGKSLIYEATFRIRHANNTWIWIWDRGQIVEYDKQGHPLRFIGTYSDITNFKKMEYLSTNIQKIAKIGGWELDLAKQHITWTEETYKIHHLPLGTPINQCMSMGFHSSIEKQRMDNFIHKCSSGFPSKEKFKLTDAIGTQKWVEIFGEPIYDSRGKISHVRGTFQDITEQKNSRDELKKATRELFQFFYTSVDFLCVAGLDGMFKKLNPTFAKVLGYTNHELLSRPFFDFIHPDDVEAAKKELQKVSLGFQTTHFEIRLRCADSSYRLISWSASPDLATGLFYASGRDLTDRAQAEEENRLIVDTLEVGIWKYNYIANSIHWDKNMYRLYGIETAIYTTHQQPWSGEPPFKNYLEHLKEMEELFKQSKDFEKTFEIITNSGQKIYIGCRGKLIQHKSEATKVMYGMSWNKTDEVNLRNSLEVERAKTLQSAKLASLGEMSAGIAHEINNPLAIISGNTSLLNRFREDPEKFLQKTEAIRKASEKISKIVNGLRKFSRSSGKGELKFNSLQKIIYEALVLVEPKSKRHSTPIELQITTSGPVFCDEIEIEQVIVNLIVNAIDAVKERAEKWVRIGLFEESQNVVLQIRDSGKGIPHEIVLKLFEPFFTTKPVGQGTGLGLSIAKGILDEHRASISILENEPNTCFEIRFLKAEVNQNAA